MREPRLLELGEIFEDEDLPRFFAHYVLLTSVFEIKRTGFNDAVGAIHCMLEETIERFGVIIAIDRVVDGRARGRAAAILPRRLSLTAQKKGRARKCPRFKPTA
jgi:hypothetical protein